MANKIVKASDCKCCVCGEQAVAFWPIIDPDIPSEPYCRKCLNDAKMELMIRLSNIRGNYLNKMERLNDNEG